MQKKTPLGCIDLYDFDPQHHRAGIGLVIDKAHRQKGYATIALELIEAVAFDQLQLHQLYAGVGEDNPASIQLFQSAGYQQCGLKKDWNFTATPITTNLYFKKLQMYRRKIALATVLLTAAVGLYFTYLFYRVFFLPNTAFNNPTSYVFIPTGTDMPALWMN